jgi:hypothetical protein
MSLQTKTTNNIVLERAALDLLTEANLSNSNGGLNISSSILADSKCFNSNKLPANANRKMFNYVPSIQALINMCISEVSRKLHRSKLGGEVSPFNGEAVKRFAKKDLSMETIMNANEYGFVPDIIELNNYANKIRNGVLAGAKEEFKNGKMYVRDFRSGKATCQIIDRLVDVGAKYVVLSSAFDTPITPELQKMGITIEKKLKEANLACGYVMDGKMYDDYDEKFSKEVEKVDSVITELYKTEGETAFTNAFKLYEEIIVNLILEEIKLKEFTKYEYSINRDTFAIDVSADQIETSGGCRKTYDLKSKTEGLLYPTTNSFTPIKEMYACKDLYKFFVFASRKKCQIEFRRFKKINIDPPENKVKLAFISPEDIIINIENIEAGLAQCKDMVLEKDNALTGTKLLKINNRLCNVKLGFSGIETLMTPTYFQIINYESAKDKINFRTVIESTIASGTTIPHKTFAAEVPTTCVIASIKQLLEERAKDVVGESGADVISIKNWKTLVECGKRCATGNELDLFESKKITDQSVLPSMEPNPEFDALDSASSVGFTETGNVNKAKAKAGKRQIYDLKPNEYPHDAVIQYHRAWGAGYSILNVWNPSLYMFKTDNSFQGTYKPTLLSSYSVWDNRFSEYSYVAESENMYDNLDR